ncbi:hypothetical protein KI387_004288 [Taxus chinensis]|uniref:Remorin n=1 Tax=Taxus chinensis TaxID=29808 RepID=A0AA38LIN8_TAXCH|nr:hypothetical protein KI387_004288 [Taxus chinensis]
MGEEHAPSEPIAAPAVSEDVPDEKGASEYPPVPSAEDHVTTDESKALMVIEDKKEAISEAAPEKVGSINRDAVLAKVNEEKRAALVKAWEENEVAKAENKYHKALANIVAWEATKKSSSETKLRKAEEKLEKQKAALVERMKNEIATIHKKAEEKKAMVEARRGEEILKAEELGAKYRAAGQDLKDTLDIQVGDTRFAQKVLYINLPNTYFRCQSTDHMIKDCPLMTQSSPAVVEKPPTDPKSNTPPSDGWTTVTGRKPSARNKSQTATYKPVNASASAPVKPSIASLPKPSSAISRTPQAAIVISSHPSVPVFAHPSLPEPSSIMDNTAGGSATQTERKSALHCSRSPSPPSDEDFSQRPRRQFELGDYLHGNARQVTFSNRFGALTSLEEETMHLDSSP